jgi:hypothetical protein
MIRSRYRALNTIMSLASGFTGILDEFTGAVAAYSTRKLKASQPNILPADYGDGAAAAYSLRKVKASYSGNCIDVRRSSDDTTSSIGFSGNELDTTALEDFVNEEHTIADEDFSSSTDWALGTGVSIADGVMSFSNSSSSSAAYKDFGVPDAVGTKIRVSFTISNYSGSGTVRFIKHGGASFTETGNQGGTARSTNGTHTEELTFSITTTNTNWGLWTSSNFTGDIDNFEVVQITADGFVTKWYDQSGNENDAVDATQATDNDQPQIVDAGSTILENGKPAIQFDGANELVASGFSGSSIQDSYFVMNYQDDSVAMWMYDLYTNSSDRYSPFVRNGESSNPQSGYGTPSYYVNSSAVTITTRTEAYNEFSNSKGQILRVDEGADTNTWQDISFGLWYSSYGYNGNVQEIIIFDSDQSDNRQDIEWNINNHYNIYTDSWDKQSAMEVRRAIDNETTNIGFVGKDLDTTALETFATESSPVLDDYTGAAAAYSLRKVRSAYTGSAVRVRRSSDDELQDIGFDSNGDLDTTALTTFVNEDVDTYTSDFTGGTDGWFANGGTADGNIDGISDGTTSKDDVLRLTLSGGATNHSVRLNGAIDVGNVHDVSFEYYIPTTRDDGSGGTIAQTIDGIKFQTNSGVDGNYQQSVVGTWTSVTISDWSITAGDQFRVYATDGGSNTVDADDDVFYLKNIVVTQTTADGAVTTWYDQTVPTEEYVSNFSSGVNGFSTLNSPSDAVTRLASVTDDYSTTVENVLQYEVATVQTMRQQLRNNLGLTVGSTYKVSFKMLIDSENKKLLRAGLDDGAGNTPEDIPFGGKLTETGRWTTFTDVPVTQQNVRLFFAGLNASDSFTFESNVGDKFYIADVSVDEVNDATQTTADNQPLVVSGGTPVTENSKAAVQFDGVDDHLDIGIILKSAFHIHYLHKSTKTSGFEYLLYNSADQIKLYDYLWRPYINSVNYPSGISNDGFDARYLWEFSRDDSANIRNYRNGSQDGFSSGVPIAGVDGADFTIDSIGAVSDTLQGSVQEIIIYDSDQSANRTGIEGNIGRYYNIDGFRDVFVSKWFDQSGNFNHAENSTETQQPQIVDGGSVITEGTTPKAAIQFDGVDDHFDMSNFTGVPTISQFNVLKPSATNVDETFTSIQNATTTDGIFLGQGNLGTEAKFGLRNYQGADIADSGIAMTLQQYLLAAITTSTTAQIYANGVAGAISAKARGMGQVEILLAVSSKKS